MVNKTHRIALVLSVASLASTVEAQPLPSGTLGKDWALISFELQHAPRVEITVSNHTKSGGHDNSSSVSLRINGKIVDSKTAKEENVSLTYAVTEHGSYEAVAICSNDIATAVECKIDARPDKPQTF